MSLATKLTPALSISHQTTFLARPFVNTAILSIVSVKHFLHFYGCLCITNHNILSLRHSFTIRPLQGYVRVGYSPLCVYVYAYIYYELLLVICDTCTPEMVYQYLIVV